MPTIHIIVVTPEATVVDALTSFVALPLYDGEMGVGVGHSPLIARLGPGELRFEADGKLERYFVDSGFVQIADNVVSVIAGRAMPASKIPVDDVKKQLATLQKRHVAGDEAIAKREKDVAHARAMLKVATEKGTGVF